MDENIVTFQPIFDEVEIELEQDAEIGEVPVFDMEVRVISEG